MKRRGFLQIFGAVTAHAALPMLAAEAAVVPTATVWNTAALTTAMDSMFDSRLGPAMAFFELTPADGVKYAELVHAVGEQHEVHRVVYQTFALGIEGGTAEAAEARLAEHFYDSFSRYAADKPLMYWRRKPQFESHEIVEYGETFLTAEEIEDEVWKFTYAKEEFALPVNKEWQLNQFKGRRVKYNANAELFLPPNVEMDFNTGAYKYVTKRTQLHKMSMRLAIPQYSGSNLEQSAHPEGERVTRI